MDERSRDIIRASRIGILGNGLLAALKITAGLVAGSLAVVGDGIDSATDVLISVITLFTARLIARPPNVRYPYGFNRADGIATKVLSFVIFFAGIELATSTAKRIYEHTETPLPTSLALVATGISIVGKIFLAFHQRRIGRRTDSSMLIANARNMQNDVIISLAVLFGLAFTHWLQMPVIDLITAFIVSLWIIKSAFDIFTESGTELMDGINDKDIYYQILAAVETVEGAHNPHRLRLRKTGHLYILDIDIEIDGSLNVYRAHEISQAVEAAVKERVDNIYDIIVHIEPLGNDEPDEKFGVSRDDLP